MLLDKFQFDIMLGLISDAIKQTDFSKARLCLMIDKFIQLEYLGDNHNRLLTGKDIFKMHLCSNNQDNRGGNPVCLQ